jgi:hypothetical protein
LLHRIKFKTNASSNRKNKVDTLVGLILNRNRYR